MAKKSLWVSKPRWGRAKGSNLLLGKFIFILVIKLKNILIEGRERSHGWMGPSGRMINVDDTHMSKAMELVPNWKRDNQDPFEVLWEQGFLRVTYMYDGTLIAHNEKRPPNERQMAALKDMAIEGDHSQIEWDGGDRQKLLWTDQDALQESLDDVEFVGRDDVDYDYYSDLNRIEKESGINILRDKEVSVLAMKGGRVIGALYTSTHPYEFSFDVIVDKPFRGQGVGPKLIDLGLSEYNQMELEQGTELRLDVVNPKVEKYLLRKGLRVLQKIGGHTIMTKE